MAAGATIVVDKVSVAELKTALSRVAVDVREGVTVAIRTGAVQVYDDVHARVAQYDSDLADVSGQIRTRVRGAMTAYVESTARKTGDASTARPNLAGELAEEFEAAADDNAEAVYAGISAAVDVATSKF